MLASVLLHVIESSRPIHHTFNSPERNVAVDKVQYTVARIPYIQYRGFF
jgi:hypothetical protein